MLCWPEYKVVKDLNDNCWEAENKITATTKCLVTASIGYMSFFNTLFKTIKTAADITNAGMNHLNNGLDSINTTLGEAAQLQKIMSEASLAHNVTIDLVSIADQSAENEIKFNKISPESKKKLDELMRIGAGQDSIGLSNKQVWPVMRRPKTSDELLQIKADDRYKEYLLGLEQTYKRIYKKCENSPEYEKFLNKKLVGMGCPNIILLRLCPNAKKRISTFTFTMP